MPRPKKSASAKVTPKKVVKGIEILSDMRDILPKDQKYWRMVRRQLEDLADVYNFGRIDTPIVEPESLFVDTYGKESDMVKERLWSFADGDKRKVVLRPEASLSMLRAYMSHDMTGTQEHPIKMFTMGEMFSVKRILSNRHRQYHQAAFQIVGGSAAAVDAYLILIGHKFFKNLGLDTTVYINSIGNDESRAMYREALVNYCKQFKEKIDPDTRKLIKKHPLRFLRSEDKRYQEIIEGAPQIVDYLSDDCKQHFFSVLEYLDDLDIPYSLDPMLMRDGGFYNNTIFEFYPSDMPRSEKHLLAGGGRYDSLIEQLGAKKPMPACGWEVELDRIVTEMKAQKAPTFEKEHYTVFIAQISEIARRRAMVLYEDLRENGFSVVENFPQSSLRTQLDQARKMGVDFILILGQKEAGEGTIMIRNVESGIQETVDQKKLMSELKKMHKELTKKK